MLRSRGTATRRSNACWTCKLRRKKCDESQPACDACVQRTITCHGYSLERPDWMDGGIQEKAELGRIQHIVKENKRKLRKLQMQRAGETSRSNLPSVTNPSIVEDELSASAEMLFSRGQASRSSQAETETTPNDREYDGPNYNDSSAHVSPVHGLTKIPSPGLDLTNMSLTTPNLATFALYSTPQATPSSSPFRFSDRREAELLMHYLDVVFALQFRFHVPSVRSGGRGWLLWLLTETKPLYHAALSLGALHQHSLLEQAERHETLLELNEHHTRALREVQMFLHSEYDALNAADRGRKRNLQLLACGVQFISFELFRGGINVWEPHLKYLATSLSQTYLDQTPSQSGHTLQSDDVFTNGSHASGGMEDMAEQFFTGAILWFDVIACASTGKGPVMLKSHDSILRSGRVDLANIVGCHSWIAITIGEIAQIHEDGRENKLDTWELVERGNPIRKRLMVGISALRSEIDDAFATLGHTHIMLDATAHAEAVRRAVTLVFAYATQVYLNTTVTGAYPYSQEVRTSVKDTASALQEMRSVCDLQASRSLVWPICIAGSMADEPALQTFFRQTIVDLGEQAHDFGNSVTVLRIMEKCWSYWETKSPGGDRQGYSWLTAMEENNQRVLLV